MCIDAIRSDLAHAIRQLREHRDVRRALDALDRVAEALAGQGDELTWEEAAAAFGTYSLAQSP